MLLNSFFIRSAKLLHPDSSFHDKVVDVIVQDGVITDIAEKLDPPGQLTTIEAGGMYLAPGFFDLNATFGEPGLETKEELETGAAAAAAGGFTGLALMPNTDPPLHSKAEISYIVNKSKGLPVDIHPLGAISQLREGKDLAELYDMHLSGAAAFSDGDRPVADSGLMSRAMLYVKSFDGLVFSYAEDRSIAGKGKMNEGETSTYLGMKGIPSLAEELMVARDLSLAEYNDSRIHFSTISSAGSVALIREARKKGVRVTCDVAAHHLVLEDKELSGFESNYKVRPPLRTAVDIASLREGLADGTIDAVVSQHTPHEREFKDVEFEIASFGIIGLQTVLPLLVAAGVPAAQIVEKLSLAPRRILGIKTPGLAKGDPVNFVLFDTSAEWLYDERNNRSRSANSPFIGRKLKGRAILVANGAHCFRAG